MNLNLKESTALRCWMTGLTICVISLLQGAIQPVSAQSITVSPASSNAEVRSYVDNVLLGSCVTVSNVSYTGPANASGTFDGSGTILGLNDGILLTTGYANIAPGPDNNNNASHDQENSGDPDLTVLAGVNTYDAVILEFDFVPQNDTLRFDYIFGSEEYPEYVNAGYNDAFGFFISGPGIAGPYTNGAENIALIPGTSTPVTIDNVNNGYSANEPATGPCTNCAYYVDNSSGPAVEYDGYTTVLTAEAIVIPCQSYHIKMAIGDAGDRIYDSGVFLKGGSFSAGGGVTVAIETSNSPAGIYEGCSDAWFIFRRVDLSNNTTPVTANYTISGTAIPGVDYSAIPTSITIPAGEDSVLINVNVFLDFITEGTETVIITMSDPPCTCLAPGSATIDIFDNDIPLALTTSGTTTICLGQSTVLNANPSGSQTPYLSGWDNGAPSGDNVSVSPTTTTTYTYTIADKCGGQSLSNSETITVIRPDLAVNDDQQCFTGNVFNFTNTGTSGGTVTHLWQFGDGNTSTDENPTHTYSASGNFTVTHIVTFTATGCTTTATIPVIVFSQPVLTATVDQNVICVGGTDGAISTSLTGGTSPLSYLWSPNGETTSGISNLGVGTYSVTITDNNGCTDNASETIIQNDPAPPTAVCQNITVQLNAGGVSTISATQIDNGSSDNCGLASMVVSPNAFYCADIGANTVTLTVTDVNGNVSTCTATVTVEDNIFPSAVCQNATVQLDASGTATVSVVQVDNNSSDNCSIQSLSVAPGSFTCADVGANAVTLTVTDPSGNVSTCAATVTVVDNIAPTAICQNVVVNLDAAGTGSITTAQINNGSSDNCAVQSLAVNPASFTCADLGNNTVTLTVTDVNGNVSTCTATVNVLDNVHPTAICQDLTVQLNASGNASIVPSQINNGSADNCSIQSVTVSPSTFTCAEIGVNTVTLTVVDGSGNTTTCTATVTVQDNISPNAVCQNITVQLDATGSASIVAADIDGGSTDNCAIASIAAAPTSFTCADVGGDTVVLTVTDVNGNVSTCSATVTVEDNVPPDAVCQDITIQLNGSGSATISATDIDNGSSDNCALASMVVSPNAFNCSDVGGNTVTLTVTDVNSNVNTCTATVTVQDTISPVALCQNLTVQLDASGNGSIAASQINAGSSDNCGTISISAGPLSFTCADLGLNTVTLNVTDANGNTSTCSSTVTVQDNIDPVAVCQAITVQLDVSGNASIIASQINNSSSDNCAVQSITVDPSAFTCANVGSNTVTLTVTDVSGNVSTCTSTVTVQDNVPPTSVCQDVTVYLDASGNTSIEASAVNNGSFDNCGIFSVSVVPTVFNCNDVGPVTATLTVTDVNGNVSTCTATVTVDDNLPPSAVCQSLTLQLDATGNVSIVAGDIDNGSTDNCGIDNMAIVPSAFSCGEVGSNSVTLTVTDVNGNISTCVTTVNIEDNIPPIAICQDITVQLDASGSVSISGANINNGSSDNCGIASLVATPNSFTCADAGPNTVILTVTDVNGNVSTCTSTVTVEDNIPPSAVCQDVTVQLGPSGTVSVTAAQVDGGSSDNCAIASISVVPNVFDCNALGTNLVVLTVTDASGNASTCTATVTIVDNVPPTPVCQDIIAELDINGAVTVAAGDVDNGSFDNCAIVSITLSPYTFSCADIGLNPVVLTVTDVSGNVSSCTAQVDVQDNVLPSAICQDITVQLDAVGNASITPNMVNNGSSDACGGVTPTLVQPNTFGCANVGVNIVTLTVEDPNGNISTCEATVTIEDNIAPAALCQNITVQLDATGNASILPADVDNGSSDNCAIDYMTVTPNSFTCTDEGTNVVSLFVMDVNGNSSTCASTVTVENNVVPTVSCQDITVYLDATGNVSISAADVDGGSNAACGIASLTVNPSAFTCANVGANTVTLTGTDNSGNQSMCNATVTVIDNIPPTAVCQDIAVQLDAAGSASILASDIDAGSSDNCAIANISASSTSFACSNVGSNSVILTVTDVNGNSSTCTSVVTVQDTIIPSIVCQNITVQLDATGQASIVAADIDNGTADNCSTVGNGLTINVNPSSFTCNEVSSTTVILTATDQFGNSSTCSATVTVEDNQAPTALCQNVTVYLDGTGNVSITSADIDNGSSDNCTIASMVVAPTSFTCSGVGANPVTLTVTDVNGNVATCSAFATVVDSINPSALCQNIVVQLDGAGNASIVPSQIDNGSSDVCGLAGLVVSPNTFNCSDVGQNNVTLTATDVNGNSASCSATVTAQDNDNPVAVCQNIVVQLDATGNASIVASDVDGGSTDNCGIASLSADPTAFSCANVGANNVVLTVTDVNGNVSTCTSSVTVEDNVFPNALCQNVTVQLDAFGNSTLVASQIDNGSTDNCAIASLAVSPNTFTCANVGANSVSLTVTDVNGNVSTCSATVSVVDNIAPTALCQNVTVQLDAVGNASITAADVDAGSTDNCAIASLTVSPNTFSCADVGANTVTLTVTDVNGNVSTCIATATVEDNVDPSVICQDITVQLDASGNVNITGADLDGGTTDNCSQNGLNISFSSDPSQFNCNNAGFNTVVLTATDSYGNTSTCSATVTVEDGLPPTAICQDVTVQLDGAGNASVLASQIDNGSNDNCGIAGMTVSPSVFNCSNTGGNTVSLTVVDDNGNSSTCTSTVTVADTVSPIAVCQSITVQLDATGNASIVATDIDNGSSDNCAIASMTANPDAFTCADEGPNTVTLTVTDVNGNVSTCTSTVTVENNIVPTVSCQDITVYLDASGNVSISAADVDGGSNAACGIASLSVNPSIFSCANVGPNTVTLTGTDNSGNSSSCTATVTVLDTIDPIAACQGITVQLDNAGNSSIIFSQVDNGSSDNCAVAGMSLDQNTFTCADVGANTVTLTVTDVNGNISTCMATVTVEDNVAPNAVCQDIPVELDATGNASITVLQVNNGSTDNCGIVSMNVVPNLFTCADVGGNTVTLTVTDVNGNSSSCTATATVMDNLSPTAVCQNITVQLDATGNVGITPADVDNGSSDNCAIDNMVVSPNTFTCSGVGDNPATLTVTDLNGNVSTCSATVTVEDTIAPSAICQNITVQLDATGNASIVATQVNSGSFDNCAIASLTVSPGTFICANEGANIAVMTVTDVNGNVSNCSATVTVEENISPTAVCQDITVQLDASGSTSIAASDVDGGSTDNCGIAQMSVTPSIFTCSNVGGNLVTLTVTDVNGNVSTCTSSVTVEDNVAPMANCQDITLPLDVSGAASIVASDVDGGSTDNCTIASLAVSPNAFTCANVGVNSVTLTVTDVNGNVSTCSATVPVADNIAPTALCQNVTVQLDAVGNASITAADVDAGSTDNCAIASLAVSPNTFSCADVGANTVTLTVTDVNGNVSTCTATATVEDNVNPTAVCLDITVQLDASGNVNIPGADLDGGTTDNCSQNGLNISFSADPSQFNCNNAGFNTVMLTATDSYGNTSTCSATVTVEDGLPPTAICQDVTVQLDGTGNASVVSSQIDNGSNDNCGIAGMTVSPSVFNCSNTGGNTVSLTVVDDNGNSSTCTSTATVADTVSPIAVCQSITVQLDATGNASIVATDIDNGSTDNCAIASMTVLPGTFSCADEGPNTVALTVTDVNGNSSTCTSTVTVENNVAPNVFCQDITVYLDASGNVSIIADDVNGGSNASCGLASLTVSPDAFNCSDIGQNAVTLTAVDNSGNSSTCNATVTVLDTIDPVAICQNISVGLDANGDVVISALDIDGGSSDNCAIGSITVSGGQDSLSFNCSDVGINSILLTVSDVNGNVSTCTASVMVEDTIVPTAICQGITVQLGSGGAVSINSVDIDGGSTDNCGIASITIDNGSTNMSFLCAQVGVNNVLLTVTDVNGNTSTCTASVTVLDTLSPTAICQNITVQLDGNGNVTVNSVDIDGGSIDNCGIASLTVDGGSTGIGFDCASIGVNTVILTVTDVNGNTSTCTASVTVEDSVGPIALCQNITVRLDANGQAVVDAVDIDGGSFDNCGIASITVDGGSSSIGFDCSQIDANALTLTVTDGNGNVSYCSATVTVIDTIAPTVVCQDITVQLDGSGTAVITAVDLDGGSTDNCSIASYYIDPAYTSWDCSQVGTQAVTLTVTDVNGNASTCTAIVTVENSISPIVNCQDVTVYLDAAGSVSITPQDVTGGVSASCGLASITVSPDMFGCADIGPNAVTLTVTDNTGNVSTCSSIVTVLDTISPTALCQNLTVQLDANGDVILAASDIDVGSSDNCGIGSLTIDQGQASMNFDCSSVGTAMVTLTVTDVSGNVSTCDATVSVEDNLNPTAVCDDFSVQLDANGEVFLTPDSLDGGSFDNCAIANLDIIPQYFDCTNFGTNSVVLTVTDSNGNTSTCISTITVEDTIAPTAVCQDIIVQLDPLGNATIAAGDVDNGSFDNCAIASLNIDVSNFNCTDIGPNTVTLTVADVNGNVSSCTSSATVMDQVDPLLACQNITVQLDANGQVTISAADVDNGSSDACGIDTMIVDITNFDCTDVGANQVTLTVFDANGNFDICQAEVMVLDTVPPIASCQDVTVQLDATGTATVAALDVDGGSTDNCGVDAISIDQTMFDCSQVGSNTVTLTVVDVNGNVSSCTSIVTVEDNVLPNANCQSITVYLDNSGNTSITANDINAGSDSNCGVDSMYVSPSDFTCADVGLNTVVLTVVDANGNTATCSSQVTVLDTISPTVLCQNITVQLDGNGQAQFLPADLNNGSFDNCAIDTLAIDQYSFDCSQVGQNTVLLGAMDVNGNMSTCTAIVTIADTVPPVADCAAFVVQLDSIGTATIIPQNVDNGSSDNCSVAGLSLDQTSFNCAEIGTNTVTLTVTDVNGNSSTCTATVIVEDNLAPSALCQDQTVNLDANGQVSISSALVDAGSTDNCAIDSMYVTPNSFTCSGSGANPVTLTITDVNGNTSSCVATVTVLDTIAPVAVCQDIIVQLDSLGSASLDAVEIDNGSNDACGVLSMTVDISEFDCSDVGPNTVVLTVEDNSGNTSTCTSIVTIEDNETPVALCQNLTVYLDGNGSWNVAAQEIDNGSSDNCAIDTMTLTQTDLTCADLGQNIIILTVTDVNGNSDDCSTVITVFDTILPVIVGCPSDTLIVPDSSNCSPQLSWQEPTATDNCSVTLTSNLVPGDNFPAGTTTVTYLAQDPSGNAASCSFDVTIQPVTLSVAIVAAEGPCGYNLTCNGAADGQATAMVSGGCLPYAYLWTDGQTTQTAVGLYAGSYAVTVTDGNGVQAVQSVVITEPDMLVVDSISSPEFAGGANISCSGASDGAVNVNITGGSECVAYSFAWAGPNGFTSNSEDLTGLEAGTYVVTVTDASGCSLMDSITLIGPDPLQVESLLSDFNGYNISCAGMTDGSIDLTIAGGATPYAVVWSNGDSVPDIQDLPAGTYVYTVTDANGCDANGSITLTEPVGLSSALAVSDYNGVNISCNGGSNGTVDLTVSNGTPPYSYQWDNGQTTEDQSGLEAGMYSVVITDANGCLHVDSVDLIEPDPISISPIDTTMISCNGTDDGSFFVQASGGIPTYLYAWSDGQMGPTAENIGAGTYVVTVSDQNGCQDSLMLQMIEPQVMETAVVQSFDVTCFGESNGLVDVTVIGGTVPYNYQWSNGSSDQDLNGVPAGTYSLLVSDASGCSDSLVAIIDEPSELILTVDTVINTTCSGAFNGEVTVAAVGGTPPYIYSWPDINQSGPIATGLAAGVYEVQVVDDNGCSWSLNVVVSQPTSIVAQVEVASQVSCSGLDNGAASVAATGGTMPYSYLWSNSTTDSVASGLSAGNHWVIVSDAAGCDTTLDFEITEPDPLELAWDSVQNITCFGFDNGQLEIGVGGGSLPYDIQWSNGGQGTVSDNLAAGTYTVHITDGNGCADSLSIVLTQPNSIELTQMTATMVSCFGDDDGEITVLADGGTPPFSYSWPDISQTGETVSGLTAGGYIFVIADANGCTYMDTVLITQPDQVIAVASADTSVCPGNGVAISATATGGAGNYSFTWDNGLGLGASQVVSPESTTVYHVEVVDQNGCSGSTDSVTVEMAQTPVAAFSAAYNEPCSLPTTVDFTNMSADASGYEWILGNGQISNDENPTGTYDQTGTYTVTLIAISGAGCSDTTSGTVFIDEMPTADFSLDNAEGCAPLLVNFGNSSINGYTYEWDFGDGSTSNLSNPTYVYDVPGTYQVSLVVSTQNGCTDTLSLGAAVSAYPSPIADFTADLLSFPEPGSSYEFVNNSTGANLYNWDFGNGDQSDEFQPTYDYPTYGGYFVTLTAFNEFGCADTAVHYVTVDLTTALYVPNAIAIGENGEGGVFLPKGTGLADYHLWIFDKWGNMLWESTAIENGSPTEGWDGRYHGAFVPEGAYVWKINAVYDDEKVWEGMEHQNGKTSNTGTIMVLY